MTIVTVFPALDVVRADSVCSQCQGSAGIESSYSIAHNYLDISFVQLCSDENLKIKEKCKEGKHC